MSGPKKIIDLDGTPESKWTIEHNAVHVYRNKLWSHEHAGCVLCVESERDDAMGQTLRDQDDEHSYVCLTHGSLEEVKYSLRRNFTVTIGSVSRTGHQDIDDMVLIPREMPAADRDALIERLIGFAAEEEQNPSQPEDE